MTKFSDTTMNHKIESEHNINKNNLKILLNTITTANIIQWSKRKYKKTKIIKKVLVKSLLKLRTMMQINNLILLIPFYFPAGFDFTFDTWCCLINWQQTCFIIWHMFNNACQNLLLWISLEVYYYLGFLNFNHLY